jgi:hypothetical protein
MHELKIGVIDRVHDKAMVAAARSMGLRTEKKRGDVDHTYRSVWVADALQAYLFGGEHMKRWRALRSR